MRLLLIIRTVGLGAIAIAAFVVAVALRPPQLDSPASNAFAIEKALDEADLNELTADSAPKQQVVNGWVARDLLAINARQNDTLIELAARDQRPAWLLVLAVLAICWWGALTWPASAFATTADSAASVPDDAGTGPATTLLPPPPPPPTAAPPPPPPPPPPPSPPRSELFIDPRPTTASP